jgi:hypothetical protein
MDEVVGEKASLFTEGAKRVLQYSFIPGKMVVCDLCCARGRMSAQAGHPLEGIGKISKLQIGRRNERISCS